MPTVDLVNQEERALILAPKDPYAPSESFDFSDVMEKLNGVFLEAIKILESTDVSEIADILKEECLPILNEFRKTVEQCKTESEWENTYKLFRKQLQKRFHPDNYIKEHGDLSALTPEESIACVHYENLMKFINEYLLGELLTRYKLERAFASVWANPLLRDLINENISLRHQCTALISQFKEVLAEAQAVNNQGRIQIEEMKKEASEINHINEKLEKILKNSEKEKEELKEFIKTSKEESDRLHQLYVDEFGEDGQQNKNNNVNTHNINTPPHVTGVTSENWNKFKRASMKQMKSKDKTDIFINTLDHEDNRFGSISSDSCYTSQRKTYDEQTTLFQAKVTDYEMGRQQLINRKIKWNRTQKAFNKFNHIQNSDNFHSSHSNSVSSIASNVNSFTFAKNMRENIAELHSNDTTQKIHTP
jgi:hypothetical protein